MPDVRPPLTPPPPSRSQLGAHVDRDALVELTRALVAVDTRNPPGNEQAAVVVARRALEALGATCTEVERVEGRTSLVARVATDPHPDATPVLVVNGHLDVVPINPDGWTRDPFGGELEGDRLYGRGMADMKGGIAAAIEALHILRRAGVAPACDVVFHLVADEERGGALGTAVLVEEGHCEGIDACLVPEPTGLEVCVAERGLLVATITTHGTPAHGSNPRNGISAIETAAKVVLALHAGDFGDTHHPLLGTASCNIGLIDGGSGHNTVAESCRITADRRLLPGQTYDSAVEALRAKIDTVGATEPELRYDLDVVTFGEPSDMDPGHPWAAQVAEAIQAATGVMPGTIGMPFTTDARFVRNQAGVPAVVCGPGEIGQAHVDDEWVSVDRLIDAAVAYAHLYASFTRPPAL